MGRLPWVHHFLTPVSDSCLCRTPHSLMHSIRCLRCASNLTRMRIADGQDFWTHGVTGLPDIAFRLNGGVSGLIRTVCKRRFSFFVLVLSRLQICRQISMRKTRSTVKSYCRTTGESAFPVRYTRCKWDVSYREGVCV